MATKTKEKGKTIKTGKGHVAATVSPEVKVKGTVQTPQAKNTEIQRERSEGKEKLKGLKARGKVGGTVYLVGEDSGTFAWVIELVKKFFKLQDVGYRRNVTRWDFPKDLKNPKKTHSVLRQFFYQIDGKFLMLDFFDDDTPLDKINLIKAWMERLGFRYTYVIGGDDSGDKKYPALILKKRLEPLDPASADYPEFQIPTSYKAAGFHF